MRRYRDLTGIEELYAVKVHVLGEETVHHIDEEDGELFEDAKEAHKVGKIDFDTLGDNMRARQAKKYRRIEAIGDLGETDEADAEETPSA